MKNFTKREYVIIPQTMDNGRTTKKHQSEILNKSILISLVDKWITNIHHFYGMNPLIVRTKIMRMGKRETQRPLPYTMG